MEHFGRAQIEWLPGFLELPNGIPSHDTFDRVLADLDPEKFLEAFMRWTQSLRAAVDQEIVTMAGKALRRAMDAGESTKVTVSAWAASKGLCLGQRKVDDESNEIAAIPKLLRSLELSGCILTIDARGTQKKIARGIIESDAEHVLALKANHEVADEEIKSCVDDANPAGRLRSPLR